MSFSLLLLNTSGLSQASLAFGGEINNQFCGYEQVFQSKLLPSNSSNSSNSLNFSPPSLPENQNRLVHYRVILPKNFNDKIHYSVVYFLHGRGGNRFSFEQLGICQAMNNHIDHNGLPFIIIAAEGGDSYWMNAARINARWGDVISHELIADVESKLRVIPNPNGRLLAGISMGGHGAFQLNLNYPGIYGALAAHSPVFRTQEEVLVDFPMQFGSGEDFQNRDPFSLMIIKGKKLQIPIWMDMGGRDPWKRNTLSMANYLRSIGFNGEIHVGDDAIGAHESGYWQYHLPEYINWYSLHLLAPF